MYSYLPYNYLLKPSFMLKYIIESYIWLKIYHNIWFTPQFVKIFPLGFCKQLSMGASPVDFFLPDYMTHMMIKWPISPKE